MKFIHLADVHLGAAPDRGCSWSGRREEEIWETFRRVIAGIRENPVDLLFIAGDLFHRQPLLGELKEVNQLFSMIPETRVFLIAGNHDYMRKDSLYRDYKWSGNVVFFPEERLSSFLDEKTGVTVYGFSFHHQEIRGRLLDGAVPLAGEGLHILLAHGGDELHVPLDVRRLASAGFDYIALGHIHKPQILLKDQAAYPGALEPLDRNDTGAHGYIEGTVEKGRLVTRFVPFACRSYEDILLELDEDSTQIGIEELLKEEILSRGRDNIYRVILAGLRSPSLILMHEKLKRCGNVIEIIDDSKPMYDLEALKKQYAGTLIGDYIRHFENGKSRGSLTEKALYYGLQALLETGRQKR